ncbi:hypothetical protein NPIL_222351, partial [Nephila pilipes]
FQGRLCLDAHSDRDPNGRLDDGGEHPIPSHERNPFGSLVDGARFNAVINIGAHSQIYE